MKAYIFPGQGAQFEGMGADLYENSQEAKDLFDKANEILGFSITDIMFKGTAEDLKQTRVTQPAIFLHAVISAKLMGDDFKPEMVAGHSLGEFSALVMAKALSFEDGLNLVYKRALAMQEACEIEPSTMAAVLGLEDEIVEQVCKETKGIVVAANYNCPGQLVISGDIDAINTACETLKEKGARRALVLPVGGAFHSPLMEPARENLAKAIQNTEIQNPICPVYQNAVAKAVVDKESIKENLIAQLTAPVRWTQSIQQMITDGGTDFTEIGPGKVLTGLMRKIDRSVTASKAEMN
ncbi:MAG TPA: [acyl-carrier-protein] S-malonyltransferase [Lutibacter sp.]|nr:[acyl-carrier-protein] S-malonyltransferase [Lutibacter sp.]